MLPLEDLTNVREALVTAEDEDLRRLVDPSSPHRAWAEFGVRPCRAGEGMSVHDVSKFGTDRFSGPLACWAHGGSQAAHIAMTGHGRLALLCTEPDEPDVMYFGPTWGLSKMRLSPSLLALAAVSQRPVPGQAQWEFIYDDQALAALVRLAASLGFDPMHANEGEISALAVCAERGCLRAVQACIDARVPGREAAAVVNAESVPSYAVETGGRGWSPLTHAAAAGHEEVVRALLGRGARVTDMVVTQACGCRGTAGVLRALAERTPRFDLPRVFTPVALTRAVARGDLSVLDCLVELGVDVHEGALASDLFCRASTGQVVRWLHNHGMDDVNAPDEDGWTALDRLVRLGEGADAAVARELVRLGTVVSRGTLWRGVVWGSPQVLQALVDPPDAESLASHAPLSRVDLADTMRYAAEAKPPDCAKAARCMEVLLGAGVGVGWRLAETDTTFLHMTWGAEQVEVLARHGAALDARDRDGRTPAMAMLRRGAWGGFLALAQRGVDLRATDIRGGTSLHALAAADAPRLFTPMEQAVEETQRAATAVCEAGVDPWVRDLDGRTALEVCESAGPAEWRRSVITVLKAKMGDGGAGGGDDA